MFAAEWATGGGGPGRVSLVDLALEDSCLKDAAAALSPSGASEDGEENYPELQVSEPTETTHMV